MREDQKVRCCVEMCNLIIMLLSTSGDWGLSRTGCRRCQMETEPSLGSVCRLCTLEDFCAAAVQWEAAPLLLGEMGSADRQAESRHVCTPPSLSLVTHCDNTAM